MPQGDKEVDHEQVAAWLADQFGDTWRHWEGGPAGIPGADLWAQYRDDTDGKKVMVGMLLLADGITSARLRAIPVGELERGDREAEKILRAELAKLPPLKRDGQPAEDFYRLVADHFKVRARYSPNPARDMARDAGEKLVTVHSWINRARTRGFLPQVARGKRARG